jgi:hypothetical protein
MAMITPPQLPLFRGAPWPRFPVLINPLSMPEVELRGHGAASIIGREFQTGEKWGSDRP